MDAITFNTQTASTVEIFGLNAEAVHRLIPAISMIYDRWERQEILAGGAVAEAAALAHNSQEEGFCIMTIAAALERSRLMAEAVRVARQMGPQLQQGRGMIFPGRPGEA